MVGILATDYGFWYGAIVSIEVGGVRYFTGGPGWKAKAVKMNENENENANEVVEPLFWTEETFNSCGWKMADILTDDGMWHPGKALGFPYDSGARYVWAEGAGENDSIYLRLVVGGEDC